MEYYLDIAVLPDPEFAEHMLMSALFAKFHRGISKIGAGEVGISFPDVSKRLGRRLRLHGSKASLDQLMASGWLKGLRDYVEVGIVSLVPTDCSYRTVRRIQAKSASNKRKRSISKGWLNAAEATTKIPDNQQKKLACPFVQIKSQSNGNAMTVYIQHGELQESPATGVFSSYGLSKTATVPWF